MAQETKAMEIPDNPSGVNAGAGRMTNSSENQFDKPVLNIPWAETKVDNTISNFLEPIGKALDRKAIADAKAEKHKTINTAIADFVGQLDNYIAENKDANPYQRTAAVKGMARKFIAQNRDISGDLVTKVLSLANDSLDAVKGAEVMKEGVAYVNEEGQWKLLPKQSSAIMEQLAINATLSVPPEVIAHARLTGQDENKVMREWIGMKSKLAQDEVAWGLTDIFHKTNNVNREEAYAQFEKDGIPKYTEFATKGIKQAYDVLVNSIGKNGVTKDKAMAAFMASVSHVFEESKLSQKFVAYGKPEQYETWKKGFSDYIEAAKAHAEAYDPLNNTEYSRKMLDARLAIEEMKILDKNFTPTARVLLKNGTNLYNLGMSLPILRDNAGAFHPNVRHLINGLVYGGNYPQVNKDFKGAEAGDPKSTNNAAAHVIKIQTNIINKYEDPQLAVPIPDLFSFVNRLQKSPSYKKLPADVRKRIEDQQSMIEGSLPKGVLKDLKAQSGVNNSFKLKE